MLKIIDIDQLRLKNVLKDFFYDRRFQMLERKKLKFRGKHQIEIKEAG
jgi:hypothetical protein